MKSVLRSLVSILNRLLPERLKGSLYRLGPFTRWMRTTLNRISPTGLTPATVSAGGLAGARLILDLQTEKDYWLGTYEMDLQHTIRQQVQPGWVAYDVGANIGYISLLLARAVGPGGEVHAFEALPANLERLQHHIQLNDLSARVHVNSLAVVDKSGPVSFLVGPSGAMGKVSGSAGRDAHPQGLIEVTGITLDDYVFRDGNPPPQVVKMDIEGGEVLALQGMARLLRETRPLVLLELHGPEAGRVAWQSFNQAGYQVCRMAPDLPVVASLDDLDWKAYLVALP